MGDSLASHCSQHVGWHSSWLSYWEKNHQGCFGRVGSQGFAITAFKPLPAQNHMLHRQGISFPICQALTGVIQASTTKVHQQCWKEWAGWCSWDVVPNLAILAPKTAFFASFIQGWTGLHTIGVYNSVILAFLNLKITTWLQMILSPSKFIHHF